MGSPEGLNKGQNVNSFLVLGQIPGTNFQISFAAWLNIAGVLLAIIIISVALRSRRAKQAMTLLHGLTDQSEDRKPLHASHLHQRAQ